MLPSQTFYAARYMIWELANARKAIFCYCGEHWQTIAKKKKVLKKNL
jgi:hypothetical protein